MEKKKTALREFMEKSGIIKEMKDQTDEVLLLDILEGAQNILDSFNGNVEKAIEYVENPDRDSNIKLFHKDW